MIHSCSRFISAALLSLSCLLLSCAWAEQQPSTLTMNDFNNLEIFNNEGPCLFDVLDRTKTSIGSKTLKKRCLKLEANKQILERQQAAIKCYVDNDFVYFSTEKLLEEFSLLEKTLCNASLPKSESTKSLYNDLFFQYEALKNLNNSPLALSCAQTLPLIGLAVPTIEHILVHLGINSLVGSGHKHHKQTYCSHDHKHHHHNHEHHENHAHDAHAEHDHHHEEEHNHTCLSCMVPTGPLKLALGTVHWGFHLATIVGVCYKIKQKFDLSKTLQEELVALAKCLSITRKLYEISRRHTELTQQLLPLEKAKLCLDGFGGSEKLQTFIKLINSPTFTNQASSFSNIGKVLVAHRLLDDIRAELDDIFSIVGTIDMLTSCAKLMKTSKGDALRYTFARFIENETPRITTENSWHPLLSADQSSHSFNMGTQHTHHMLLTGNNGCGKSLALKMVGSTIWMAQTLGIVPAKNCTVTPFSSLITIAKVGDSTASGMSFFMTECALAEKCIALLEKNETGHLHTCCLVDEPFKGTSRDKALSTAAVFIEELVNKNQCISITTSHMPELAQLYQAPENSCFVAEKSCHNFFLKPGVYRPESSVAHKDAANKNA